MAVPQWGGAVYDNFEGEAMWNRMYTGIAVGFIVFLIGVVTGRYTSEGFTQQATHPAGSSVENSPPAILSRHNPTPNHLSSDAAQGLNGQQSSRQAAETIDPAEVVNYETGQPDSNQVQPVESDATVVLTPDQQLKYNDLSQRIDTSARYGGLTMAELQSQMAGMPKEYQVQLLDRVVRLVNKGELDPQTFIEGVQ